MNKKLLLGAGALAVLAAAGAAYWYYGGKPAQSSFRLAKIERGSLVAAVSSTGTLNPVVSVQVGSQVSGQIKEIFVDYNSVVKKGDVIARIDPDSFALRVNQAMADLEAGRATALTQRANVAALQAEVSRAQVALAEAERDLKRNQSLVEKGFVAQAVLEKSQSAAATARENVKTAQAQRAVGDAQVRNGEALVKQRESQLAQAKVDLERTTIRAPVDGIVISRSVDAGQTVAASLQAPTLFLIARNLTDMQVEASIDEAEIGRVAVGQDTTFTVDSFPGRTFNGKITQVRKAAQVVQNVVTYIAVISAPNPDQALLPGMSTNVRIITARRNDVVKLPNAALRFRPPGAAAPKPQTKGGDGAKPAAKA
ncbi:MAG: efflux RND transporter periplasmic adaptor subunit, partial [Burkholderiales bacterium]